MRDGNHEYTDSELRQLLHNDHEAAFRGYVSGSRHAAHKERFLLRWVDPQPEDYILECGSSSGKTSVGFVRHAGCRCLGIDFDPQAVAIATGMRDRYFPELADRCRFEVGDLTTMRFDTGLTKFVMPDFSEHVPDRVLGAILDNIRRQFTTVTLYIYTPCRSHVFEVLKHRNWLLRNPPGHINVKTRRALTDMLTRCGWRVTESTWHYSAMPYVGMIERALAPLPLIGPRFQRRLAIRAVPATAGTGD